MYLSNQTCPDCGYRLHVTWEWPAIILNEPVKLIFICQNCAINKKLEGYAVQKPFEQDVIIVPVGRNVLERHHDAYDKALSYIDSERFTIIA